MNKSPVATLTSTLTWCHHRHRTSLIIAPVLYGESSSSQTLNQRGHSIPATIVMPDGFACCRLFFICRHIGGHYQHTVPIITWKALATPSVRPPPSAANLMCGNSPKVAHKVTRRCAIEAIARPWRGNTGTRTEKYGAERSWQEKASARLHTTPARIVSNCFL